MEVIRHAKKVPLRHPIGIAGEAMVSWVPSLCSKEAAKKTMSLDRRGIARKKAHPSTDIPIPSLSTVSKIERAVMRAVDILG